MTSKNPYQKAVASGVHQLQTDFTNGARILASNALHSLVEITQAAVSISNNGSELFKNMSRAAKELTLARQSMGSAVSSTLLRALDGAKQRWEREMTPDWRTSADLTSLARMASILFTEQLEARKKSGEDMSQAFVQFLKQKAKGLPSQRDGLQRIKLLTLSASSSLKACILAALQSIDGLGINLLIMESRPRCEGAEFAVMLSQAFPTGQLLSIEIATDASVASLARDVDLVLLGSDRISSAGDVSNKMGSLAAVLCARYLNPQLDVVVASETDKIARPEEVSEHKEEENDLREVSGIWQDDARMAVEGNPRIRVRNLYFEWVESRLIDAYVTEQGVLGKEDIEKRSRAVEQLEKTIFKDL